MRSVFVLVTLTLLFILASREDAYALVMCGRVSKPTGEIRDGAPIRLREACKAGEVEIDAVELGLQGPSGKPGQSGSDGDDGADGVDGLACWDLNGNATCDPDEDRAEPFGCTADDCQGPTGSLAACESRDLPFVATPFGPRFLSGDETCALSDKTCVFGFGVFGTSVAPPLLRSCQQLDGGAVVCCGPSSQS